MMGSIAFLHINYNLNQVYFVEKSAIEKVILKTFQKLRSVELVANNVFIDNTGSDFEVELFIKKGKTTPIAKLIPQIEDNLNQLLINLCGYRPRNIQMNFVKQGTQAKGNENG